MILRPIQDNQLVEFFDHFRSQYIEDRRNSDHLTRREAEEFVASQWESLLPKGTLTPGHYFMWAFEEPSEAPIGLLWLFIDGRRAFIYQILVFEKQRGHGFGRAILREAEALSRRQGAQKISLNVFTSNASAIALYKTSGYVAVSAHMAKPL